MYEQSYSYDWFHESSLDIAMDYELLAMETQVELEQMREHMQEELVALRDELGLMKKIVTVETTLHMVVVCTVSSFEWM